MESYRFSPSERTVATIAEFVGACQAEPQLAAEHLHAGYFEPWLRDAGRPDLADAAALIRQGSVSGTDGLQQFVQTALAPRPRARSTSRRLPAEPAAAKARTRTSTARAPRPEPIPRS